MSRFFATILALIVIQSTAHAKPPHKQALVRHFGPFLANKLNDCRLCHLTGTSDGIEETEKPHNPFGARLAAVSKNDLVERFETIAEEDSDGDGCSNILELLTGHSPGDPRDVPSKEEQIAGREKTKAFREYLKGYRWRPYEVVQRPSVPVVKNAAWVRNPIDAFVSSEHEKHGLTPRPPAPKEILLRRVYFDLTGLPPTRSDLQAFLADSSADAYEKVVERLLNSPQYGEAQARHWMDIWRYSDWAGFGAEVRDSQPHVWRWRDWIVESLNEDKGYDRMIREMLAGDEIGPDDPKMLRATGFLVRNYKRYGRERWMQDTVEHTFLAFQAVTINCCRCHDHMYDPIAQKEYYQVRAIFEPHNLRLDRVPGQADVKLDGVARVFDAELNPTTYLLHRGDERTPDKSVALLPAMPIALGGRFQTPVEVKLPPVAYRPERQEFIIRESLSLSVAAIQQAEAKVTAARIQIHFSPMISLVPRLLDLALLEKDVALAKAKDASLKALLAIEDLEDAGKIETPAWKEAAQRTVTLQRNQAFWQAQRNLLALKTAPPADAKLRAKLGKLIDDAEQVLAKAEMELKAPATTAYTKRAPATYPMVSTGRRLAFANWLSDKSNPLTARVAMNHVWLKHFGQAIVPSVFDFGRNGRLPTHPALLDWLAAEFMEQNWSLRKMHRLMVTSATYRQASTPTTENLHRDPDNTYLWRFLPHRLEAEKVRDAVFATAGKLDLKQGGPDIDQTLGFSIPRRSIYFRHAAEKQMEFLKLFDAASVTECYHRRESIIPQQALALFNSSLAIQHARILARTLAAKTATDVDAFITMAFETVLTRSPTEEEMTDCRDFLRQQTDAHAKTAPANPKNADATGQAPAADPALRARENLVHVLFNHHDFVTVR